MKSVCKYPVIGLTIIYNMTQMKPTVNMVTIVNSDRKKLDLLSEFDGPDGVIKTRHCTSHFSC